MIQINLFFVVSVVFWSVSLADFDGDRDVGFYIYTRKGPSEGVKSALDDSEAVEISGYDSRFPTKFVTHGFVSHYLHPQVQLIKDAYLQVGEYNVIAVDWSGLAQDMDTALENNHNIGQYIGKFILFLVNQHVAKLEDIHVIGHSLGGQLVSFVADVINDPKVGRITGLDPSGVLIYENATEMDRLDSGDADLVDVFHTSQKCLQKLMGDVDYYPNGGANQTGCPWEEEPGCDHATSWRYFADSILYPNNFLATRCDSIQQAEVGACYGDKVRVGEYVLPGTSGIFYKDVGSISKNH